MHTPVVLSQIARRFTGKYASAQLLVCDNICLSAVNYFTIWAWDSISQDRGQVHPCERRKQQGLKNARCASILQTENPPYNFEI